MSSTKSLIKDSDRENENAVLTSAVDLPTGNSPVKSLPTETLVTIFKFALPDFDTETCKPSIRNAPLNISWTCEKFRDIVLLRPEFWANIEIWASEDNADRFLDPVQVYIERSLDVPLSFYIDFSDSEGLLGGNDDDMRTSFRRAWKVLSKEQYRWKDVRVFIQKRRWDDGLLPEINNAPCLEKLDIYVASPSDSQRMVCPVFYIDLSKSIHLNELSLRAPFWVEIGVTNFKELIKLTLLQTDYEQTRVGGLRYAHNHYLYKMARVAPHLKELHAAMINTKADISHDLDLEHLRILKLYFGPRTSAESIRTIVHGLHLHRLEELHVEMKRRYTSCVDFLLDSTVGKLGATITSLGLYGIGFEVGHLWRGLASTPHLKTLTLTRSMLASERLMSGLTTKENGNVALCPFLELVIIEVDQVAAYQVDMYKRFSEFALSRLHSTPRSLKCIQLRMGEDDTTDEEIVSGLDPLFDTCSAEGLEVTFIQRSSMM